jgi:hypothetical protein
VAIPWCWCCVTEVAISILSTVIVSTVYRFNDQKEQKYGSVYVEQIINIASQLGKQRGGNWEVGGRCDK